jgi:hypothetical protein
MHNWDKYLTIKIISLLSLLIPINVFATPELVTIGGQQYVLEGSLLYSWNGISKGNLINQGDLLSALGTVTFTSGNGTTQNPYTIDYCLQLQAMQNNTSAAYQLGRDIDCSDTIQWNSGAGFRTIGYDWNHRFFGSFDGNYKLITGLTINRPSTDFVALFGRTSGGVTLKNVGLVDVSVTGRGYVGALLGQNNMSRSYVSNAWSTGQIIGNGDRSGLSGSMGGGIGGLIGLAVATPLLVLPQVRCSSSYHLLDLTLRRNGR